MTGAARAAAPLVQLAGLAHSIAGKPVMAIGDWQQTSGDHALVLGPSGSGKTTLINAITGLITPSSGSVHIDGEPMSALPASARDALRRRTIGLVFQTLRLIPALSVRQNLALAQHIAHGKHDAAAIESLIARVGLAHRIDARPRTLSQGEGQRAAIARALITRPRLVVADEPTSALDDANALAMIDLLFETAAATGATLLVATHDTRIQSRFATVLTLRSPARAAA
ncbi:putative ABC transport system ATP-binding protein [Polymorphobacter multimanifer]|uniref:Putative ABC transport system ATP-binding protein n=1 Tax=Polymorphobacter multimanifer TaxID=1070431 RepID=A0A841L1P7_9SPHN|nr:ATP-binding cassette domain-containing protein [Polymorphobacter multimanifer]MBB6226587.1 putative ABC transport system ATP-binding protein [Polymorphobacter multimanifer]